jgi:nucleotide-binding universal stress UspA family protein
MYKHVLVAVGTRFSDTTLLAGIERAREHGARLTALHVIDEMPWWAVAAAQHDLGQTLAALGEHAQAIVCQTKEVIERSGIDGETRTVKLPPHGMSIGRAIADAARNLDADLIVVGPGRCSRWQFWEERVIDGVSRHADRAVLIASYPDRSETSRRPAAAPLMATRLG